MPRYLRDEKVSDITINEEALSRIVDALFSRYLLMPEYLQNQQQPDVFLIITIRFDEKGYRVFEKETLLKYFLEANDVEIIIFELSSGEAIRTNKSNGSYIDIRFDKHENSVCFATYSSDDENWLNGSYNAINEILKSFKNYNYIVRNPWVELLIQLTGIFLGFIISLYMASKIAPNLTIYNSFLISFVLVLLVFSNLWSYANLRLKNIMNNAFPKISFKRPHKDTLLWIKQTLIGSIIVAVTFYLIGIGFNYIGKMLGAFIGSDT